MRWCVFEGLERVYDDARLELCVIDARAMDNPEERRAVALRRFTESAEALFFDFGVVERLSGWK